MQDEDVENNETPNERLESGEVLITSYSDLFDYDVGRY